jgi:hypothetical protein
MAGVSTMINPPSRKISAVAKRRGRRYDLPMTALRKPPASFAPVGGALETSRYSRLATLEVFERMGGTDALLAVAQENPKWFYEKIWVRTIQPEKESAEKEKTVVDLLNELDQKMKEIDPGYAGGTIDAKPQ